ncbi:MAG: serine/threonine-protein kinase [Myxococcales bacterium]|nr:serine/threonine protein kinase [Myxococcota bacterium]MDW8280662.1 serine/threonine-protein kinase [Myxococcales bacterium]
MEDARIGTILDGLYRLDQRVGEGGVGTVYRAHHLLLGRDVAVKLLHPQYAQAPEPLERFRREALLLSNLGHPGFVKVYDFGYSADGTAYLAMEFLQGETLRARLMRGPVLSVEEVMAVFRPLCEALEEAHRRDVLHRDLKPDNVMLLAGGGIKILDFGMAKLLSDQSQLTSERVVMGTPNYLAPERVRGRRDADVRSDIFSLGAILYESLSGRFAFHGPTAVSTMHAVVRNPIPPLGLSDPELSSRLDLVVATACAKDPRDRYPSALELWRALSEAVDPGSPKGSPVPSAGPTKVKASLMQGTLGYIHQTFGPEGIHRLRSRFGAAEFDAISHALPTAWLDIGELHRLHSTINALFDDGSFTLMRQVGRFFADQALGTTYRSFLTAAGPLTLVKRAQVMYNTMASMGELRVLPRGEDRFCIQLILPGLTRSLLVATAGWAERYLELSGARDLSFFGERIIDIDGRPVGEIEFSFRVPE